jgi:hypothetical protein
VDVDRRDLTGDVRLEVVVRGGFHPPEADDPGVAFGDDEIRLSGLDRVLVRVAVVRPRPNLVVAVPLSGQALDRREVDVADIPRIAGDRFTHGDVHVHGGCR